MEQLSLPPWFVPGLINGVRCVVVQAELLATWTKRAHIAREPFGPITGPKDFACRRHALNKDFFGAVENHLFAMRFVKCVRDVVLTAYCSLALR